jgi:hypothetical protein
LPALPLADFAAVISYKLGVGIAGKGMATTGKYMLLVPPRVRFLLANSYCRRAAVVCNSMSTAISGRAFAATIKPSPAS